MKTIRNIKHVLGFCILLLLIPSLARAAEPIPATAPQWKKVLPAKPPGITMSKQVIATYNGRDVTMVVYVPDKPGIYPAILDIHGGGWSQVQVEADKPMMEKLAERGFVTAIVAYRLSGEAKFPAALYDCKSAVRFLRAHASQFKIDEDRIGVMGGSAGGHLAALLAMTNGEKQMEGDGPNPQVSSDVKACIVMAATQDMAAAYATKPNASVTAFLGGTYAEVPEVYRLASPINHVKAGVPPTIFIEGEKDTAKIGRPEMQEKLRALHVETDLHTLKDAPHPFWMSQPWLDQTVDIAAEFFKKHL